MELAGKVAVVSGGASGLGKATVSKLLSGGARVAILDRDERGGRALAETPGTLFVAADVADGESVNGAIEATLKAFGRLDIGVSCAGMGPAFRTVGREGPAPLERFARIVDVNLVGTFNLLRLAAAAMTGNDPDAQTGERGVLVNTASVAAFDGQIGQAAYAASKAGVVGMTLPVARDLASLGIRVNTIAPGLFRTPMLEALPRAVLDSLVESVQFPKRAGLPEEFAEMVAAIVANPYLNGETIRLDAAVRMPPG